MLNKINLSSDRQKLIVYLALTVVTFAVFWQVNRFGFVNFDDQFYVTENSHIQSGISLDSLHWAFSTKYFDLWNPLVWLSFMSDYQLFGLNAGGYHLTNLILHILSALLLFRLFNRMTGAIWKSAFVAAFFAVHPLHVESVAWISERKDVLSAFFWMLTLCLYVYYTEKPAIKRYLLVVFSFVLALMSKPMVVTLPVIMILLDYWPLGRFESREVNWVLWQLKEKIPFFILSAVIVLITLYTPDKLPLREFSLGSRLANAPVAFVNYILKTFMPRDLAIFYPFSDHLPIWQVSGAVLLIIVISAAVIVMAKRLPYLFVGWLWYAIILLPVIGIIPVGGFSMADRYHYLPSIGIAVGLTWGIPRLFKSEHTRKIILFPLGATFIALLSFITWQQCGYWKNSIILLNHALQVTNNNYLAHNNIAPSLDEEGKTEEAIYHYDEAIRFMPDIVLSNKGHILYNNRGGAYAKLGRYQRALEDFNEAIRIKPDYADSYFLRGNAYADMRQYQQAIEDYDKVIRLKHDFATPYFNKGTVEIKIGLYQMAVDDFSKAIRLKPDYADAYNNRGGAYLNLGNKIPGCYDAQKACKLGNCKASEWAKGNGICR